MQNFKRTERQQTYERYLQSPEWKLLRTEAIQRYGRKCALTGLQLRRKETNVHHWVYRNLHDVTTDDLSVLGDIPHMVVHYWIKAGLIDCQSPDRLVICRKFYLEWKSEGQKPIARCFKRLSRWLKKHRKERVQETKKNRKLRRKLLLTVERPAGFQPPKMVWSSASERDRHKAAYDKYFETPVPARRPKVFISKRAYVLPEKPKVKIHY